MGEKSDEILGHIESQRNQLGRNLEELETRVKRTTDWKAHFEDNPMMVMGVALGGGLLLGALVGGKSDSSSQYRVQGNRYSAAGDSLSSAPSYSAPSHASSLLSSPATNQAKQHAVEALDKVKAALIAFGMTKAKEFLSTALPGIEEHLGDLGPTATHKAAEPTATV